jgi:hypothetical protein
MGHVHAGLDRHCVALRLSPARWDQFGLLLQQGGRQAARRGDCHARSRRRKALYQKANRIIMDDAAYVPIDDDLQPILLSPKVKGFVNPPEDWYDLSTVSVE